MSDPVAEDSEAASPPGWFFRGVGRVATSLPALILMTTFIGFGALARETGLTVGQAVFMTGLVWALPSQIVLIGAISAGTGLAATFVAVALSAVRLLPMTMALAPVLRGEKTPKPILVLLSHFVAVTAWVEAMVRLPKLPRQARVPFFAGFVVTLSSLNMLATGIGHIAAAAVPPMFAAALAFLTPVYFLMSLTAAARLGADRAAMAFGLVLGPVFHFVLPGLDLMWTGLVGGTAAYLLHRFARWPA